VILFKHPLSLLRLALFLQDALRTVKRIERPLVVVGRGLHSCTFRLNARLSVG
jgi:cell division control protein 45